MYIIMGLSYKIMEKFEFKIYRFISKCRTLKILLSF